jgi:hypothetical protein
MASAFRPLMSAETCRIVEERNFIHATREVGYRSLADAVAELIDNAIQAQARHIRIYFSHEQTEPMIAVLDDGCGMRADALRAALQFGGTDRFGDRSGLGRFGMGLPCSSISYARRLEVYSWQRMGDANWSYLDVDEIAEGTLQEIPRPRRVSLPPLFDREVGRTGTLVIWRKCDRIELGTLAGLEHKLCSQLGRMFRYFLWSGIQIRVNNHDIVPVDPLFCHSRSPLAGAQSYGDPIIYKIRMPAHSDRVSEIQVRFSELPVLDWRAMSIQEKRRFGIVKGAGVSLIRARREIAYGWYFMGDKRRENYDDWWRCEVAFGPELDDYFHPTHTKQEIHPALELENILTPDMEGLARILNSRVRASFAKSKGPNGAAARLATGRDKYLPPFLVEHAKKTCDGSRTVKLPASKDTSEARRYVLTTAQLPNDAFYAVELKSNVLELKLNTDHAFFESVYMPVCTRGDKALQIAIECFLFALARAEAEARAGAQQYWYNRKRVAWSNILATFLGS